MKPLVRTYIIKNTGFSIARRRDYFLYFPNGKVALSLSGDPPDPVTEARSPALQADSLPSEQPGKPSARNMRVLI